MPTAPDYNFMERLLHTAAFAHPWIQRILAELEGDLLASKLDAVNAERPVFVTGLPRAGTTLVLELLYGTGEFATVTYRQMPFVLSPILWSKLSTPFQRSGSMRERAHGDGVQISFDSPEAFEEVLWLTFLKERIVGDKVLHPLGYEDLSDDFREAFAQFVRKIILLHQSGTSDRRLRYLSKNNANISRLQAIERLLPDATILVPFRQPWAHVSSLMKQHRNFLEAHSNDTFSRNYMRWIGHYDFGRNFKPIDFDGQGFETSDADRIDVNFWLTYWVKCYRYCLTHAGSAVHFIDYDALLQDGEGRLRRLAETLQLGDCQRLVAGATSLRGPTSTPAEIEGIDSDIWRSVQEVHQELRERGQQD